MEDIVTARGDNLLVPNNQDMEGSTGVVGWRPCCRGLRGGRRGQWEEGQEEQKSLRKRGHARPGKELGESGMGAFSVLTWMEGVTTPSPDFRMGDIFPFV